MAFDASQWQVTVTIEGEIPSALNNGQTLVITQDNLTGLIDQNGDPVDFFAIVNADGSDIRLSEDDAGANEIPFELVDIDTGTDKVIIWTRKPIYDPSDRIVKLHFGKSDALGYNVTDAFGRNAVWQDFLCSAHLVSGTGVTDSSGNVTDLNSSNSPTYTTSSNFGDAATLNGINQSFDSLQISDLLESNGTYNVSIWATFSGTTSISSDQDIFEAGVAGVKLWLDNNGASDRYGFAQDAGGSVAVLYQGALADSGWFLMSADYDGSTFTSQLDNSYSSTSDAGSLPATISRTYIGQGGTGGDFFKGAVAGLRVRDFSVNESQKDTEHSNQKYTPTFWDVVSVYNRAATGGGGEEQVVVLSSAVQTERATALNIIQHQHPVATQAIQRESASELLIEALQKVAAFNAIQAETAKASNVESTQQIIGTPGIQNESAVPLNIEQAGAQNITLVNAVQAETAPILPAKQHQILQGIIAVQLENAGVANITEAQAITLAPAVQNETAAALNIEQYSGQLITLISATQKETASALFISSVNVAELRPAVQNEAAQQSPVTQNQSIIQVSAVQREVAEIMRILASGDMTDLTGLRLVPITETYSLNPINHVTYTLREL